MELHVSPAPAAIGPRELTAAQTQTRTFGLDAVRACAIVLVLLGHACFTFIPITRDIGLLEKWMVLAYLGVDLFFVLSGYLICGILASQIRKGSLKLTVFWTRRWLRTLPNYYLFLLLNLLLDRWISGTWYAPWSYLIFMQCFAWPHPAFFPEAWSLTFEEIFYLLAPVVLLAWRRVARWQIPVLNLLAICIGLMTVARIGYVLAASPDWDAGVRKIAVIRFDAFLYGAAAMYWYRYVGISPAAVRTSAWIGLLGVAVGTACYLMLDRDHNLFARTLMFSLVLASFALLMPRAAEWRVSGLPAWVERAIRHLAAWSYSLYLCQLAVIRVLTQVLGWQPKTVLGCFVEAIVYITLATAIAAFTYRFFERPILRWRDRITASDGTATAPVRATTPASK